MIAAPRDLVAGREADRVAVFVFDVLVALIHGARCAVDRMAAVVEDVFDVDARVRASNGTQRLLVVVIQMVLWMEGSLTDVNASK